MTTGKPARTRHRRARTRRLRAAGLLLLVAAVAAIIGHRSLVSSSSSASLTPAAESPSAAGEGRRGAGDGAEGAVPDHTSVFDDAVPGVANLDPALLDALRRAATDAAADGVAFVVDSGWRSPEYQERLLDAAVAKYGSREAAARWVATPQTSAHVTGDAVDLGPAAATEWLSARGAAYGLCRIYGNESWPFELRPDAVRDGCPPVYPDPTYDPRMRR